MDAGKPKVLFTSMWSYNNNLHLAVRANIGDSTAEPHEIASTKSQNVKRIYSELPSNKMRDAVSFPASLKSIYCDIRRMGACEVEYQAGLQERCHLELFA